MKKTLIVGMALGTVAAFAMWHGDLGSFSSRVDAQQARGVAAVGQRVVAVLDVGDLQAAFSEVSGLGSTSEVVEYRDGSDDTQKVRKIPGRLKWEDITLKRGLTDNLDLWNWRKMVEDGGEGFRKNGTLTLFDNAHQPVAQWNFENAWPSKVSGPTPKADGSGIALEETVVLTHEFIQRLR